MTRARTRGGRITRRMVALFVALSGGQAPWRQLFTVTWIAGAVCFVAVLPFLVLASYNSLFRERLQILFQTKTRTPVTPTPVP